MKQFLVNSGLQRQNCSQPTIWGITWITSACTHSLVSSVPPMDQLQTHLRYSTVTKQWRRCLGGQTEITLNCALNHSSKCWESREELKTTSKNRNSAELSASQHKQAASPTLLKEMASQKLNTCWENLSKSLFWEIHICYQKCSTRQGLRSELPYSVCKQKKEDGMERSRINWDKEHKDYIPTAFPGSMYPKGTQNVLCFVYQPQHQWCVFLESWLLAYVRANLT